MFLGLDIGTSSVKAVLVDDEDRLIASASEPLCVSRPAPGHSEQDPEDWWRGTLAVVDALAARHPREIAATSGMGLSGQMHGAVLLGRGGIVLRPAILWNDGRSQRECRELEEQFPDLRAVTGNLAMPGFTAPKLLWVRRHEPDLFATIEKVLLPKAYVRWRLTGAMIEDMSDASGTLWLDVAARAWSQSALAATGLSRAHMPDLTEGTRPAGALSSALARRWGMARPPVVAGGAGDNAASAVALGAVAPGNAFLSLGTSGVLWATTEKFAPNPEATVHAFCHAVPQKWHQMGVILSAASALTWLARLLATSEAELLGRLGERPKQPGRSLFLPYLSGERTPHNAPGLRGLFAGLDHDTSPADLTQAVIEGVAFAFRDCRDALAIAGTCLTEADVVGGGSRSRFWVAVLACVLDMPLRRVSDGEAGAAAGAARLGRLAATGEAIEAVCSRPRAIETIEPDPSLAAAYTERFAAFRGALTAA